MSILFQDQFEVKEVGKKFDKVSRLHCRLAEEGYEMVLDVDINSDLFNLEINDRFTFALASTLALDGAPDSGTFDQSGAPSLLDQYEYVMYGKLYKWKQEQPKAHVEVYVSFGGLLMRLRGDPQHLEKLHLDSRLYLLMRKISVDS
uniref:DNA-directed RNA polymerases I, II, and III subunit RPABC3 n=1 Tax=Haptolina brevifila TaxID=156173 RepID=A0A7S2ICS3_9EUKA|mmetsp:Transcript_64482/g.127366  ORF Transcript_64482/g.127366 Transcript_64482/m.127366 type:complete len:146 (+) Transcript_64482:49-486(+)